MILMGWNIRRDQKDPIKALLLQGGIHQMAVPFMRRVKRPAKQQYFSHIIIE